MRTPPCPRLAPRRARNRRNAMAFWTRKANGREYNGRMPQAYDADDAWRLRPDDERAQGAVAQADLLDGALASATEMAQSLRKTADQAQSVASSGEQLASSANEFAAS